MTKTTEQIKYMVNRFLEWRLPENFNPDGGISFTKTFNESTPWPMKYEPTGTNLLDATQAEEMVRYMVEGMPAEPSPAVSEICGKLSDQTELAWICNLPKGHGGNCSPMTLEELDECASPEQKARLESSPQTCRKCGRNNPVWFAPNEVWNVINQTGILCPICFIEEAELCGLNPTAWELRPESQMMPIPEDLQRYDATLEYSATGEFVRYYDPAIARATGKEL